MYLSYRVRLRTDGLLVSRNLRLHQLQEVLVYFLGIFAQVHALASPAGKVLLTEARDKAQELQDLILTQVGPVVHTQIPIPEELVEMLRLLQRQVDLRSLAAVNHLLDYLITNMANLVATQAENVELDEYQAAAARIQGEWFADGRGFLRLDSRRQWAETQRRFERPTPRMKDDLRLLRLHKAHERIIAFNNWFARLQGIDPTQPIPEELTSPPDPNAPTPPSVGEIEERTEALLAQLIGLATALWPSPSDPNHARARTLLLSKLMDKIQEASR
jgi:hypothetical protein